MTPPRDLADAQQRLDQLQGYLDQFIDALADRDARIQAVHGYARGLRDFAQLHRDAEAPYVARIYDDTAAALERIIGGEQ